MTDPIRELVAAAKAMDDVFVENEAELRPGMLGYDVLARLRAAIAAVEAQSEVVWTETMGPHHVWPSDGTPVIEHTARIGLATLRASKPRNPGRGWRWSIDFDAAESDGGPDDDVLDTLDAAKAAALKAAGGK